MRAYLLAWVNGSDGQAGQMRMRLNGDRFVRMVLREVFVHLVNRQHLSLLQQSKLTNIGDHGGGGFDLPIPKGPKLSEIFGPLTKKMKHKHKHHKKNHRRGVHITESAVSKRFVT